MLLPRCRFPPFIFPKRFIVLYFVFNFVTVQLCVRDQNHLKKFRLEMFLFYKNGKPLAERKISDPE